MFGGKSMKYYTIAEIGMRFGVGRVTVKNWIKAGKLTVVNGKIPDYSVTRFILNRNRAQRYVDEYFNPLSDVYKDDFYKLRE